MRVHLRYLFGLLLGTALLSVAGPGAAQRRSNKQPEKKAPVAPASTTTTMRPESVVMLPESAQPKMDTALINPKEPQKRRRRFEVKVVPAAPPGRSRQEIMYTDSIANRSPRR